MKRIFSGVVDRSLQYQVTLTATADDFNVVPGEISLADDGGKLTYLDSANGTLVFTGYHDDIQAALANGVWFDPTQDFYGEVTLNVAVNDQGHVSVASQQAGSAGTGTGSGSLSANEDLGISVAAVNDIHTLTVPADQTMDEDTSLVLEGFLVDDVDMPYAPDGSRDLAVDISIPAGTGSLTLGGVSGLSGDLDGSDGRLSFTGEIDALNEASMG